MTSISAADATTAPDGALAPIALGPGEGEHFWFFGGLTTIKADGAGTGGCMMLTEAVGWGPTARVASFARAWAELARQMDEAEAATVVDLDTEGLLALAPSLWVVQAGG